MPVFKPFIAAFIRRTLANFRRYVESHPELETTDA
jgi:hypothetical protein